jgi:dipeptidyl aminopeptidase/acylaminoacyl peptidase
MSTTPGQVLPYGSWPSPITAADVARAGVRLGYPRVAGADVWWLEGRPAEGGRQVLVSAEHGDLLPAPWNARTRVHEYGGASYLPLRDGLFVFTEFTDQRLYLSNRGGAPRPLTPEPDRAAGLRYADLVVSPDGLSIWCVREEFTGDGPSDLRRAIVSVPLDGSAASDPAQVRVVVAGSWFYAFPRISPDGRRLAWIAWNHPDMPWDATTLRVGDIVDGAVPSWQVVLGGEHESVLQPEWLDADTLIAMTDRSNFWNPWRIDLTTGAATQLIDAPQEFAGPLWQLGMTSYAVLDTSRLLVKHAGKLGILDLSTRTIDDLELPYSEWFPAIDASNGIVAAIGASPTQPWSALRIDLAAGTHQVLRVAADEIPDAGYLPTPYDTVFDGPAGRDVHAHVYPPSNRDVVGPDDELPPFITFVHGGPTAGSPMMFDLLIAYFTSRGLGVVDVDYGGSAGYGREYRERLRGQWGVVDVEDCVAAVQALAASGVGDGARMAIRGGSAGGWTTLAALTRTRAYAAGTSLFGVAELVHFVADTHDFESRYIDGLVGRLPEDKALYIERAPLSHVDDVACPVLLLQGLEDAVVPPSQAEMFRDALAAKGIPHAYLAFEGEQHGFRKATTIVAALEAELSFYGQIFGFTPPGVPRLTLS